MAYNIAEAAWAWRWCGRCCRSGPAGYILVLYICEVFNFSLSIHRLDKITR
jgi:hypothetical protein